MFMDNLMKLKRHYPWSDKAQLSDDIAESELKISVITDLEVMMLQRSIMASNDLLVDISKFLAVKVPEHTGAFVSSENEAVGVISVGPTKWYILGNECKPKLVNLQIPENIKGKGYVLNDLSDQMIMLKISGVKALAFLSKGCAIDLREDQFLIGQSASTLIAKMDIILWRNETSEYHLMFDISLWSHLSKWITEAIQEYKF